VERWMDGWMERWVQRRDEIEFYLQVISYDTILYVIKKSIKQFRLFECP
jgi:hypothetical protein